MGAEKMQRVHQMEINKQIDTPNAVRTYRQHKRTSCPMSVSLEMSLNPTAPRCSMDAEWDDRFQRIDVYSSFRRTQCDRRC